MGMGSMTGRGAGYCAGYGVPGFANPAAGRGLRMAGRNFGGGGRGFRHWYHATGLPGRMRFDGAGPGYAAAVPNYAGPGYGYPTQPWQSDPEQEKQALKRQAEALQAHIDVITGRISEIESGASDSKP